MFESRKLSEKEGVWRVDAVGALIAKVAEKEVPKIRIYLSQIKEDAVAGPLVYGSTQGKQCSIVEPLNRISKYLIGSCWENGVRINRLPPFEQKFLIDTSRIKFFCPSEKPGYIAGYHRGLLPPVAIELGGNLWEVENASVYALVPVLENERTEYLVIPCSELYRFYFGASDRLLNAVVRNDFERYFSWDPPYLKVNSRLSRMEQFTAYRSFWDQDGLRALRLPSSHLKNIAIRNELKEEASPLALKSGFPFEGLTRLTVAGKRFPYLVNGKKVWAVFAANIIHCDKPVGFDEVKVLSDTFSETPDPFDKKTGSTDGLSDNPFDDDDSLEESDELPNAAGRPIAILRSNNRFSALKGMAFKHSHTDEDHNPVYESDSGFPMQGVASGEIVASDEAGMILQESSFESHQDAVDRNLSDFISMIIHLRNLSSDWIIETRALDSVLEVEGEVVTAFLSSSNRRKKWHIIEDEGQRRLRQIAWVEIQIEPGKFLYLAEMELSKREMGRSTLCIYANDFGYMRDADFRTFLGMTAVQNRWPKAVHSWRTKANELTAQGYFEKFEHVPFTHDENSNAGCSNAGAYKWAKTLESKIKKLLTEIKS